MVVKNVSQIIEIKQKKVENYKLHLNEIQEKVKNTNRAKYGCDWITQSELFKQKYKNTCIEKYSVDNYTKSIKYLNQVKTLEDNNIEYMVNKGYIPLQEINMKYGTGWHQQNRNKITLYKGKGYVELKYIPEIEQYSTRTNSLLQQEIFNII